MINTKIIDSSGSGTGLKVNGEGTIGVLVHPHPPFDEEIASVPFRQYFTTTGIAGGTSDMRVNGATTAQRFYIKADSNYDIYVKSVYVVLADAGAKLDKFGALTALTNGVLFEWETASLGALTLFDGFKQNLDFFKLTKAVPQIVDLSGGGADAIIVPIDLGETFGNTYGLRIKKASTDKLVFTVQDNLSTGLDEFNIAGIGLKI